MSDFQLYPQLAKDCFVIANLDLCRLLLMNDTNYPWCVLVPRRGSSDNTIKEVYELTESDQLQLMKESNHLSQIMMSMFDGFKMNTAALGNMVPQLHIHHVVRNKNDACWPKPVWGQVAAVPYSEQDAQKLIVKIQAAL